jgi:hypothetical protein
MPSIKVGPIIESGVTPHVPKSPVFETAPQAPADAKAAAELQKQWFIVTRDWAIFFERLGGFYGYGERKCTWGILEELTLRDKLCNHYICRQGGKFGFLAMVAKNPPLGSSALLEIEKSRDRGITWASILKDPYYVELQEGDATLHDWVGIFPDGEEGRIKKGDLLAINCIQPGSIYGGNDIEIVLQWF